MPMYVYITLILASLIISPSEALASCHLASGKSGLCAPISQCGQVTALISNLRKPLPTDVALLVREAFFCGSQNGEDIIILSCFIYQYLNVHIFRPSVCLLSS